MKTTEQIDQEIQSLKERVLAEESRREDIYDLRSQIVDLEKQRMAISHPELHAKWTKLNEAGLALDKEVYKLAEEIRSHGLTFNRLDWR